jgi:hypothetical protein
MQINDPSNHILLCLLISAFILFTVPATAEETLTTNGNDTQLKECIPHYKKAYNDIVAEGSCPITVSLHISDQLTHRVDVYDYFLIEERDVDSVLHELDEPNEHGTLTFKINVYWGIVNGNGELDLDAYYLIARPVEGVDGLAIPLNSVLPVKFNGQIPTKLEGRLELRGKSSGGGE